MRLVPKNAILITGTTLMISTLAVLFLLLSLFRGGALISLGVRPLWIHYVSFDDLSESGVSKYNKWIDYNSITSRDIDLAIGRNMPSKDIFRLINYSNNLKILTPIQREYITQSPAQELREAVVYDKAIDKIISSDSVPTYPLSVRLYRSANDTYGRVQVLSHFSIIGTEDLDKTQRDSMFETMTGLKIPPNESKDLGDKNNISQAEYFYYIYNNAAKNIGNVAR